MTRIGIESELPVVDQHGEAAGRDAVVAVFDWLVSRHQFVAYRDGTTGAVVGVRTAQGEHGLDVGTDYGFCTLEVAFPPEDSLQAAEVAWNGFLDDVLLPALASQGLSILGYGCQPKTAAAGRAYIAPKGHYGLWATLVERYPSNFATDAWPSFASLQFNLDVPLSKIVRATNTFIKLSPMICAWSANSPIFGGQVQPWLELRAEGYLALAATNPFFTNRLYFPRRLYVSLADYMNEAWAFPIFEITRDGVVYHPVQQGLTTFAFASGASAEFVDLRGTRATLRCTPADLATALVFAWPAVRIKFRLGDGVALADALAAVAAGDAEAILADGGRGTFIEIRHLPTMSRQESFAWLAMFLGWLADIDRCAAVVEDWSLEEVKTCFTEVLTGGWAARIHGRPLRDWGTETIAVAGNGDATALLRDRLAAGTSPATDALRTLADDGIDALVDALKLG